MPFGRSAAQAKALERRAGRDGPLCAVSMPVTGTRSLFRQGDEMSEQRPGARAGGRVAAVLARDGESADDQ